jgi:invasion protein IalB
MTAMKGELKRTVRVGLFGLCAAILMLPVAALAQTAAPATAPAASVAGAAAKPVDSPWVKMCAVDPKSQVRLCNISQVVLLAKDGSMIGSFSIEPKPDKKLGIGAFVPLGFVIPAGVTLAVDGEKKAVAQFTICIPPTSTGPAGCAARADLGDDFIAALRKGKTLSLVLANTAGQAIPIDLRLAGFGMVYDSEGVDPVAAHALTVEGDKQLQEAARAAFKRTLDAQQKQGGSQAPAPAN